MLMPTSMPADVRGVEWVRTQPGGNWLADNVEHLYHGWKAPKKGGPQLTALPTVGEIGPVAASPTGADEKGARRPAAQKGLGDRGQAPQGLSRRLEKPIEHACKAA
jgi:hypothetical protein